MDVMAQAAAEFAAAAPFPHIVLRDYWDSSMLRQVAAECDAFVNWDGEKKFFGSVGKRFCGTRAKLPPATLGLIDFCSTPEFLGFLEQLTSIDALIPDPYLFGGGIHSTINQGFLKMHADFNWHNKLQLYRRLNVLIYLNPNWDPAWGGDLRLARSLDQGLRVEQAIFPEFNTMVVFNTTDSSFHGHPDPMQLPAGMARNSIALYYYTAAAPTNSSAQKRTDTDYRFS